MGRYSRPQGHHEQRPGCVTPMACGWAGRSEQFRHPRVAGRDRREVGRSGERGAAGSRVGLSAKELGWEFFLDREGSGAGRKGQELCVWKQRGLRVLRGFGGSTSRYLILGSSASDHGCDSLRTVALLSWFSHSSVLPVLAAEAQEEDTGDLVVAEGPAAAASREAIPSLL